MKKLLLALVLVVSSSSFAIPPRGNDFNDLPPYGYLPPCGKDELPPCGKSQNVLPPWSKSRSVLPPWG